MRFNDKRSLMRYNGMCPNMFDTYGNYSDAVGAINNPLGGYTNVADNDLQPRGAFLVDEIYMLSGNNHVPQAISDGASSYTVYVRFTSSEPLLLSPFIWAHPETNNAGFYGIQNMNAVFNVGDCSRAWRSSNPWLNTQGANACAITVDSFSTCSLIFNQLTPHPSDLLPSRNVVPYYTLPRYITQFSSAVAPIYSLTNGIYTVPAQFSGTQISSTNIQLNQIPDKLIIFVRKAIGSQTPNDSDCYLPIRNITMNFNNHSGILSTATPQDLYRYSVESGSNQSWQEFYGIANKPNPDPTQGTMPIPTTGSLLCLKFGEHINLTEDYYALNLGQKNNTVMCC